MALLRSRLPLYSPITGLTLTLSFIAMFTGLRRIQRDEPLTIGSLFLNVLQTVRGVLYMMHWMVVMSATTARMSVRPKRLKWVKTVHQGTGKESFEF